MLEKLKKMSTVQIQKKMETMDASEKQVTYEFLCSRVLKGIIGKQVSFVPYRKQEALTGVVVWSHIYQRDGKCYVIIKTENKKYYKQLEAVELIEQ